MCNVLSTINSITIHTVSYSAPPALNVQKNFEIFKTFQPIQKLRYSNSDLQLLLSKPFRTFVEDSFFISL
jgi:hypothetical protein